MMTAFRDYNSQNLIAASTIPGMCCTARDIHPADDFAPHGFIKYAQIQNLADTNATSQLRTGQDRMESGCNGL